ncbi:MAG: FxLYD domain-containing protein [Terriglobia bacterium]
MPRNDRGISTLIIILIVFIVLAALTAFLVLQQHTAVSRRASAGAGRPALSAEQKAYLDSLAFADFHMSAAANFLGDTVTYLDASVTNKGSKAVRRLDVELNFVDTLNQVVLRETAHPLTDGSKPLQPGETQAFRVTFEHMPVDWNQSPPAVRAVYVDF